MDRAPRSGTQGSTVEGLIAAMAVVAILYFGRAVFVPLALAILLSFVLNPAAMLLRRLWFGRVASALTVILLAACLMLGTWRRCHPAGFRARQLPAPLRGRSQPENQGA